MTRARVCLALIAGAAALAACGGEERIKCSFKNPIVVDEGPDQWPKFRRDSQNTGTIRLNAAAYAALASTAPRRLSWSFPPRDRPPRGPFVASPALTAGTDDRRIYIGSVDNTFYVLRASDGAPFTTQIGEGISFVAQGAITSTAIAGRVEGKDAVVVGTGDGRLYAVDQDGILLADVWPFVGDAFIRSSPAMTISGLFLTATLGGRVAGVCPNGVARFGVVSASTESSPAVGRDPDDDLDGTFYVGSSDRRVRAVTPDGFLRWTFSMSAPIVSSPVVELAADGMQTVAIYTADVSGSISKIADSGRPVGGFDFIHGSIGGIQSSPALAAHPLGGKRLYVGSEDGNVYAVDAGGGAVLWSFGTNGIVRSSPAVVLNAEAAADPILIVGSFDGTLYYIRDSGDSPVLIGTFSVPADPQDPARSRAIESSPAVGTDGTIYFGANDGRVYAVR